MAAISYSAYPGSVTAQNRYHWEWAANHRDIVAAQRLRYRVFAEAMGTRLQGRTMGLDRDGFDTCCHHLLVRNRLDNEIVACTRLLTRAQAHIAGSFYSNLEFDIHNVLNLPGRGLEIGRTCVDPRHCNDAVIDALWSAIAQFVSRQRFDYVFGCAGVDLRRGRAHADGVLRHLREAFVAPAHLRVKPRLALPESLEEPSMRFQLPPLLKAYTDLGAKICGEPCWDPDFGAADVFMLLRINDIEPRYRHRFVRPAAETTQDTALSFVA